MGTTCCSAADKNSELVPAHKVTIQRKAAEPKAHKKASVPEPIITQLSRVKQPGHCEDGTSYSNVRQLWEKELKDDKEANWYMPIVQYWNEQPATIDGVLGGYKDIHSTESISSAMMLEVAKLHMTGFESALDCGAGIGRVTKETLLPRFKHVDLLEPASVLLDHAKEDLPLARNFFYKGMQEHNF